MAARAQGQRQLRGAWQQALTLFDQLGHPDAEHVRTKLATLDTDPDTDTNN